MAFVAMIDDLWDERFVSDAEDFYISIDHEYFFEHGNTNFVMSKAGTRQLVSAMVERGDYTNTYFSWLPIELIQMIFEMAMSLMERDEQLYYMDYFSDEQVQAKILREMRVRPGVVDVAGSRYKEMSTPLGTIKCRNVYLENDVRKCTRAFASIVEHGIKSIENIRRMKITMEQWFIWVCDHTYSDNWEQFMRIITKKVYEINYTLSKLRDNKLKLTNFSTPESIRDLEYTANQMKFFIEDYIPYALLTRSTTYFKCRDHIEGRSRYEVNTFAEMLFNLFTITGRHPNEINKQEAYEFEMATYAPEYFYNVYAKYKRSDYGKRLVPEGEKPVFYWRGGHYVHAFV